MAEITELDKHSQGTSRDKYKTVARARKMRHDELRDHVESHMLGCTDPDCDICDMGDSGDMIDDDDEGEGPVHDKGSRSSKGREGAGEDTDEEGVKTSGKGRKDPGMHHKAINKASSKILESRTGKAHKYLSTGSYHG